MTDPGPEEPPRRPLPIAGEDQPPDEPAAAQGSPRRRVKGYKCTREHLNKPGTLFCRSCGRRMDPNTLVLVEGERPSLGLLVFDDGTLVNVDTDYLLGRAPETHEGVRSGQCRPLRIDDRVGTVGRHHAQIHLDEWDVFLIDAGSANGTLVAVPGSRHWSPAAPGVPVRLTPGMSVRMGSRHFSFESRLRY